MNLKSLFFKMNILWLFFLSTVQSLQCPPLISITKAIPQPELGESEKEGEGGGGSIDAVYT